jgi:hypothetical protein
MKKEKHNQSISISENKKVNENLIENNDNEIEITIKIKEGHLLGLEIIQTAEQQKQGREIELSEIIQKAIEKMIRESLKAIRLDKNN